MANQDNPFDDGAAYDKILGMDRDRIRQKIRRGAPSGAGSLLTSRDLFGDIIEDIKTGKAVPEPAGREPGESTAPPNPDTAEVKTSPGGDADSPVDAAYSALLQDPRLNREVNRISVDDPPAGPPGQEESDYGHYQLLEPIAAGGMAEVFRAKRKGVEGFEKVVAVKRILSHLSMNQEFVDMFVAEAKMVAGLSHPNIVQIFDLGKIGDSYYIAMEFVDGRDLRSILTETRRRGLDFGVDLSALVAAKVCSGLEYAHRYRDSEGNELRIVHRDVSPQNILISLEGEIKLTDFGIAKAAVKASHTDSGSLRGKLLYMSPEQAWGKSLDKRSDIFSLGAVLFEVLTGHSLFAGGSEMGILERVRKTEIVPPSSLNPAVPIELKAVLTRALQKDPDKRYQDASEMLRDLDSYLRRRPAVGPVELSLFVHRLFHSDDSESSSD